MKSKAPFATPRRPPAAASMAGSRRPATAEPAAATARGGAAAAAAAMMPRPPLSEIAQRVHDFSSARWGAERPVELIGNHPSLLALLEKVQKFARFNEPVLITGESGTGKELIAKSLHLLGWRRENPFVSINCPQFHDGNTIVSELFGHRKGSFTGAVADHKGLFENAHQGVLFLDEIADLPMAAQVILLRTLAEGEFRPLGDTEPRTVNVRSIAATNRPLQELMDAKLFRLDLYFRLRYFRLDLPPLRERGDDWRQMLDYYLARLNVQHGTEKRFSAGALRFLAGYAWPGNIRELRGLVTMGYSLSESDTIELTDFQAELSDGERRAAAPSAGGGLAAQGDDLGDTLPTAADVKLTVQELHHRLVEEKTCFWGIVHTPFIERDLNRVQVKALIEFGLQKTRGSYRKLANLYHLADEDYHRFMDFLRHHDLKPDN